MINKPATRSSKLPKWINYFDNTHLTLQLSEYHYFSSNMEGFRPITLYNLGRPVKMHLQVDNSIHNGSFVSKKTVDQSPLKDFGYLQFLESQQQAQIVVNESTLAKQSQWINKYQPSKFSQLLTDQKNNRIVLLWLKSWDHIVFNKQVNPKKNIQTSITPNFFNNYSNIKRNNNQQSLLNNLNYQINHQKMILLAGPPGCGKTTLARVIAKHCEYQCAQINASDDRTAKNLIQKIANMSSNETIRKNKLPTLIILDEVDGAMDGDANGLKDVIKYIQTGHLPKQLGVSSKHDRKKNHQKEDKQEEKMNKQSDRNSLYVKRPIIFICNDPYAKGLKQLRKNAKIIYFSQLQTERVVRRLKQVCEYEKIYIDKEILTKIAELCSNDIRSSLGVLQLACKMKETLNIPPKQFLSKLKLSLNKDSQQSINELVWDVLHKKVMSQNPNNFFKEMEYRVMKVDQLSLLVETLFCNLHRVRNNKSFGVNFGRMSEMYNSLIYCDFIFQRGFHYDGQLEKYISFPFTLYHLYFRTDDCERVEFPKAYFDHFNKEKANLLIIQQLYAKMDPKITPLVNRKKFKTADLWTLFLSIQPPSLKDEDILKCLSLMISYGLEFSENHPFNTKLTHIYKPDIESLFTYNNLQNKYSYLLSNSSKALMENSFESIKNKLQFFNCPEFGGENIKQPPQLLLKKLNINSRKKNGFTKDKIKYKYQEGSGTQIKCTLKLEYFL